MKKLLLALSILPMMANATGETHFNALQPNISTSSVQGQAQVQNNVPTLHSTSNGGISDANSDSISSIHYSNKRNPVNSAIAPAIDVNVICPVITVGGHAVQLIVAGISTTGKANVNGICMAYHLGQFDVVQNMLCNTDSEYKKANSNCK